MSRIQIELPEKFLFTTEIPVRISDINRARHLGSDRIMPMMEEVRMRYLLSQGYDDGIVEGHSFIMVDAGIVYKKQGYYGQTFVIDMGVADMTSRSFDFVYRARNRETGDEMVRVKTGMLFYDYRNQKVVSVPEGFRKKVSA